MPEKENYNLERTSLQGELGQGLNATDASTPKSAGDEIRKALGDMQLTVREQQLGADKQLQSLLGLASTYIESTQRLDLMLKTIQQVAPLVQSDDSIRSSNQQVGQALQQLTDLATTHQNKIASGIAVSLQESVSSLAQASVAMAENQALTQVTEMLKTWKSNLSQMGPPPQQQLQ